MIRRLALVAAVVGFAVSGLAGCGDDGASANAECRTVTVDIGEFVFSPTPVEISRCDSVVWKNTHDQAHTSTGTGPMSWTSGNIEPGGRSEAVVFNDAGEFPYMCALHPFMKGAVKVTA